MSKPSPSTWLYSWCHYSKERLRIRRGRKTCPNCGADLDGDVHPVLSFAKNNPPKEPWSR
jgi:hypothetical protein